MSVSVQTGSTISHYRVISPIGAGGMGEVYMARDESLERSVALKVLPPELVKNEERVRRFVQEAKSASSLSHPNIVTIYEIGKAEVSSDGQPSSAPLHFIAMELITGDTLKHKIHQEKADLRTLLGHLAQAAEGLAKAHTAGIVHRDLKPENIMVSNDGFAKVLDFGLAKLSERADSPEDLTSLPTMGGGGGGDGKTREGAILGTINYMSPEQVRGKVVDHRSDVFAFGSILYEAATRKRPFVSDSDVEVMHRILHDKPQPIEELNPECPAVLRRLVRRCLAKNPEQRFQNMKDVALELEEMVQEYDELTASGTSASMTGSIAGAAMARKQSKAPLWIGVAAAVAVVAAAAFFMTRSGGGGTANPYQNMRLTQLTRNGNIGNVAFSPDGKYLAHVIRDQGKYGLWVRQVATGSDVEIQSPLDTPFRGVNFSPDGNYVYYVNQEVAGPGYSTLYQVPSLGGPARELLFDIDTAPTFSPDGSQIAFMRGYPESNQAALLIVNADGSGEREIARNEAADDQFWLSNCSWSPDGKRVALIAGPVQAGDTRIVTVDIDDGSVRDVGTHRWTWLSNVSWLADGSGLVTIGAERGDIFGQVWHVAYPSGNVTRITNDLNNYDGGSVTVDNAIATVQSYTTSNIWKVPIADQSAAQQITHGSTPGDGIFNVRSAGNGMLLFEALHNRVEQIWSMRDDGSGRTQLTNGANHQDDPFVDVDRQVVVYEVDEPDGTNHIWKMNVDGSNQVQLTSGSGEDTPSMTPDGRWVVYKETVGDRLWRVPIEGGEPELLIEEAILGIVRFSPDGRYMAYTYWAQGGDKLERQLAIAPADGGERIYSHPWPNMFGIRWTNDSQAVTFIMSDGPAFNIWRMPITGGQPTRVTHFDDLNIFSYDWSPDGSMLYVARGRQFSDVVMISQNL